MAKDLYIQSSQYALNPALFVFLSCYCFDVANVGCCTSLTLQALKPMLYDLQKVTIITEFADDFVVMFETTLECIISDDNVIVAADRVRCCTTFF